MPVASVVNAASPMVQLYDNTASGAIASWDVTGISGSYNALQMFVIARSDVAADSTICWMRFNNDSGANQYEYLYYANSNSVMSATGRTQNTQGYIGNTVAANRGANRFSSHTVDFPGYAATTAYKTALFKTYAPLDSTAMEVRSGGYVWLSTAAINRITIYPNSGNFVAGSRLTIYGLL